MLVVTAVVAALALPQPAAAQSSSGAGGIREVSFSIGRGRLSHGDDPLGSGLTLGGAVTIPVMRRFAVRVDGHRSVRAGPEGAILRVVPDVAVHGHRPLRRSRPDDLVGEAASTTSRPAVRNPTSSGGLDVLHFTFLSDVTTFRSGQVTITDFEQQHTTMGITLGGGVRVPWGAASR